MTPIPNFYLHELLEAVHGYDLIEANNDSFYCPCPWHNHDSSQRAMRVWANGDRSSPSRDGYVCHYGESGNTWDYLHDIHGLPPPGEPGFDEETVHFICSHLNLSAPEPKDGISLSRMAQRLIQKISDRLQPIQFNDENQHYRYDHERGHWLYRGLPPMKWLGRGVGMLPENELRDLESEFSEEVFKAAGISNWNGGIGYDWLLEGVIIMLNSRHETPVGLGVRRYETMTTFSGQPDPKYVKVNGKSEIFDHSTYIYGMEALGQRDRGLLKSPVLYVVEGEFDCLALQMRGIDYCVSVGSGLPTDQQIQRIKETGREPIYIADSDVNGAGSEHALQLTDQWPEAQFLFLPEPDSDPDEYVQIHGAEAIENIAPYTSLQVQMLGQPEYNGEEWTQYKRELANLYLDELAGRPSAYDEINVRTIANLSGLDEEYLRNALIRTRNHSQIDRMHQSSVQPVQISA